MKKRPVVSIVMGSDSDLKVMQEAGKVLKKFQIPHEVKILSAHRSPDDTAVFAGSCFKRGVKVIIAGAGGAAHLAGVIAAHTTLPVIGVPMETKSLKGIDSLFSTVQMPSGVPVATMAIGTSGAKNAAILAAQILGISDLKVQRKLGLYKKRLVGLVRKKNRLLK